MSIIRTGHVPFPLTDKTRGAILAWNPSDLANADRLLLSEWDVSDSNSITEETGVSVLADKLGSNDFTQTTGADQPILTDGGTKDALVTYDGIQQFLSQLVNSGNFQDLTRFEWWSVIENDGGTYNPICFFGDGSTNSIDSFQVYTASNIINVFAVISGGNQVIGTSTAISGGTHIMGIICDGSGYKIIIDKIDVTNVTGNGKFIGDFASKANFDLFAFGGEIDSVPRYANDFKRIDICFGGTTDGALSITAEQNEIFNYYNKRFDLGL